MRYAPVTDRLADLGSAKWEMHMLARKMKAAGEDVIELTIGEPDVSTPPDLMAMAAAAMTAGRTGYSNGRGEPGLLRALAARYTARRGRTIGTDQVMCLPGTQTTLYGVLHALVTNGDEVLLGDPMYAAYEGLIQSTGATVVPVPLQPEAGFRMRAEDVEARITPASRVLFLNSPHNPTGAVLTRDDLRALCDVAARHDLWVLCDEVYEDLCFPGVTFVSPLDFAEYSERVIVASSISKSHAAPGFRSGWCVGPAEFCARMLPLSETILFGSQPFIADMTAAAVSAPSPIAADMMARFQRRAALIASRLDGVAGMRVHQPQAGMFALIDVRASGLSGDAFARALLAETKVAVMPGESFGQALAGWVRVSLTQPDALIEDACDRIAAFASIRRAAE
jgi:arginine:pyruvate transaminase